MCQKVLTQTTFTKHVFQLLQISELCKRLLTRSFVFQLFLISELCQKELPQTNTQSELYGQADSIRITWVFTLKNALSVYS